MEPINSHVYFAVATDEDDKKVPGNSDNGVPERDGDQVDGPLDSDIPQISNNGTSDIPVVSGIDIVMGPINAAPRTVSRFWGPKSSHSLGKVKQFVIANFLPLGFMVATIFSLSYPYPGRVVGSWKSSGMGIVQAVNNAMVFFISGLTLNTKEMAAAIAKKWPLLFGIITILFITPCFAFPLILLPLQPKEFAAGLAIFCVVPTTLGVGVALTTASQGNESLALFLTVSTNLLGIVTAPFFLKFVLNGTIQVDAGSLVGKMCMTVLVPAAVGAALRRFSKTSEAFTKAHKVALSMFSTSNLVCIIYRLELGLDWVSVSVGSSHHQGC